MEPCCLLVRDFPWLDMLEAGAVHMCYLGMHST